MASRRDVDLNFQLEGWRRVRNQLRTVATLHPQETDTVLEKEAKAARRDLKAEPYPPMLPGQKYRRTGLTANSFFARRVRPGWWMVGNSAPRREYVIDEEMQARIHRGRWYTIQEFMRQRMGDITEALGERLETLWERAR